MYVVTPENGDGPQRTLHRDLLLPCGFLPVEDQIGSDSQNGNQRKMRTRSKPNRTKGNDNDNGGEYSDEDEMSDEEELCIGTWNPQIITKGPYFQPESTHPRAQQQMDRHSPVSSPDTVVPETSLPDIDKPTLTQPEVSNTSRVDYVPSDARSSDHVVIDIPEPNLTPTMTDADLTPPEPAVINDDTVSTSTGATEPVRLRRSDRERRPPQKFTYDELGEPLTLAISSFFQTLGVAFSKTVMLPPPVPSWSTMHEGTHAV